jgi:mannosyltransferase
VIGKSFFRNTRESLTGFFLRPGGEAVLILSITLIAALLRFYKLGEWSFWEDEVFSIGSAEDGFNYSIWRRSLAIDLIQLSISVLGTNEWNARLFPVIIGILSIPILYFLVRKALGVQTALFSAALLAVSPWHLYWSQNARFYTLLLLFYSLALLTFYIGLEKDRPFLLILSLLFMGLGARERLVAFFFVPTMVSYLLLLLVLPFERPAGFHRRNLLLIFSPMVLIGLILAGPYVLTIRNMLVGFGRTNSDPIWIFSGVVYYTGIPIVCIAAFGAVFFLLRRSRAALFFSLSATIPLLGVMAASIFLYAANRYVFVSLTSWLILAAMVVSELFRRLKLEGRPLAIGILAILLLTSAGEDLLYFRYQNGNRPNWKEAFEFIQAHQRPGDTVVTAGQTIGDYYLSGEVINYVWFDPQAASTATHRYWLVEDMEVDELFPKKARWVKENAQLMGTFDVIFHARNFKMRVFLFDPNGLSQR